MDGDNHEPILSHEEHRRAVALVAAHCNGNADAMRLVSEIERILCFELESKPPESELLKNRLAANALPASRIAIISDIHGNHAGLMAALVDISAQGCERIICLGDIVDGGTENERCIETLRERGIPCVRGNHDENCDAPLRTVERSYLSGLPMHIAEGDILYTHISPRAKKRKIDNTIEAWNVFEECGYWLTFVGHAHIPYLFGKRANSYGEACLHTFHYNQPFVLDNEDRYIICTGAIGYGRDGVVKIRYCILDQKSGTIEMRAIDGPLLPLDY